MKYLSFAWFLLFVSFTLPSASQLKAITRDLPESPHPAWMETDKALQAPVSLNASNTPLRSVLASLSQRYAVNIRAERGLEDYRVSMHTKDQPLNRVMGRLVDLFGHGTLPNRSYMWSRAVEGEQPPVYTLRRNRRAIEEEEALLDAPRQICLRWLKELRRYMDLPKEEQAKFKAECPCLQACIRSGKGMLDGESRPLGEAFAALSESQFEPLIKQGSVELPTFSFSPQAQEALQTTPEPRTAAPRRNSDPSLSGVTLQLERENFLDAPSAFYLSVLTHDRTYCTCSFIFDTQRQFTGLLDTQEMQMPPAEKQGSVVDLFAHWKGQPAEKPSSLPLESVLELLAKEAGVTIYAEAFAKWPLPLSQTKGTPEQLLTPLCASAGYLWRKVGKDFLVYSRSWAQDRQANVPQSLLDRWLSRYAKNGRYVLADLLEMARLRDEQIRNLIHWIDVQSPLSVHNRACLRLLRTLPPVDLKRAYDADGVSLDPLDAASLAIAQNEFKQGGDLSVRAFIQRDPDQPVPSSNGKFSVRKSLTVTLQDQSGMVKKYFIIEPSLQPQHFQNSPPINN